MLNYCHLLSRIVNLLPCYWQVYKMRKGKRDKAFGLLLVILSFYLEDIKRIYV
jgi:hypothetical protein